MTERDAFEVRFGAAVRGYAGGVTSDLDPVELARQIAAREPRRRGLVAALGRPLTAPRGSWVLLLIAALLIALVASMIVIGSQPIRQLPALVPPVDQLFTCPPGTNPDEPGPVGQARPAWGPAVAFDRRAGKIVAVLGPLHDETWTFDVCTNIWTEMHPDPKPEAIGGMLVYDVDSDLTVTVDRETGAVWAYDLQGNTWSRKGAAPTTAELPVREGVYDPLSGHVVVSIDGDPMDLWSYNVDTDRWTPIRQRDEPHVGAFAYDASVDRIVVHAGGYAGGAEPETWLFDIRTGTWTRSYAEMPEVVGWLVAAGTVYDEAAERTMVFRRLPLTTFDATADRWEILDETATSGSGLDPIVYDPVNRRLVGLAEEGGVEAIDLVASDWTVLLAPDDGQPVPSAR